RRSANKTFSVRCCRSRLDAAGSSPPAPRDCRPEPGGRGAGLQRRLQLVRKADSTSYLWLRAIALAFAPLILFMAARYPLRFRAVALTLRARLHSLRSCGPSYTFLTRDRAVC